MRKRQKTGFLLASLVAFLVFSGLGAWLLLSAPTGKGNPSSSRAPRGAASSAQP